MDAEGSIVTNRYVVSGATRQGDVQRRCRSSPRRRSGPTRRPTSSVIRLESRRRTPSRRGGDRRSSTGVSGRSPIGSPPARPDRHGRHRQRPGQGRPPRGDVRVAAVRENIHDLRQTSTPATGWVLLVNLSAEVVGTTRRPTRARVAPTGSRSRSRGPHGDDVAAQGGAGPYAYTGRAGSATSTAGPESDAQRPGVEHAARTSIR